ncbi:hypothetical protein JCM30394_08520 [Deferrisoma palaeochoriense]
MELAEVWGSRRSEGAGVLARACGLIDALLSGKAIRTSPQYSGPVPAAEGGETAFYPIGL